ncbi:MAG: PIN domain-containing protein [Chloroflexota bacterium]|nr:PIN domain-containing protein [Chloroflexota bacterium]MDE2886255.1 PIN domain-containing protein [Chloroflexota bacterium]
MILLDTDVLLDVALNRHPHADASSEFLAKVADGTPEGFVAWHSVSNLFYVIARARGAAAARDFITGLMDYLAVAPASTEAVRYAASLPMADFEDAMQVAAARACNAEYIVTRNLSDFERSPIPAVTPQEALTRLH